MLLTLSTYIPHITNPPHLWIQVLYSFIYIYGFCLCVFCAGATVLYGKHVARFYHISYIPVFLIPYSRDICFPLILSLFLNEYNATLGNNGICSYIYFNRVVLSTLYLLVLWWYSWFCYRCNFIPRFKEGGRNMKIISSIWHTNQILFIQ